MGLPSGTQWANFNVGAEKTEEPGLYFSWGNIVGHEAGEGYDFSQVAYNSSPAADIATDLSMDQDAAREYLGDRWRMPTAAEFQELYDNCTVVWTTLNGVNGRLFTSNVNGAWIFLPAAGVYNGTTLNNRGSEGLYWSSTYLSATNARLLYFNSSDINPQNDDNRRLGFPVRAVLPPL